MTKHSAPASTIPKTRPQSDNCSFQTADGTYSSHFSMLHIAGEAKFLRAVNFKQGIRDQTRQITWCITLPVLSWQTSVSAFVLLTQRTTHPSHTGPREKTPAKIWWTWRVTGFTDHMWQWQNQGTTKLLYFFFSSRAKGQHFWNRKHKLYSLFVMLTNCRKTLSQKEKSAL